MDKRSATEAFYLCAIVPSFNHIDKVENIIQHISSLGINIILVNDGSNASVSKALRELAIKHQSYVELMSNDTNRGKGFSVIKALRHATKRGFSHAIQVDADGQHSLHHLSSMVKIAENAPNTIISGIRDRQQMPTGRRRGRAITDFWVKVNTLGSTIEDSMCGLRIYPLKEIVQVLNLRTIGQRMDLDTDILDRSHWHGIPILQIYVDVRYELEPSRFHILYDNARISWMHTKLFFCMLPRVRQLLKLRNNVTTLETTKNV